MDSWCTLSWLNSTLSWWIFKISQWIIFVLEFFLTFLNMMLILECIFPHPSFIEFEHYLMTRFVSFDDKIVFVYWIDLCLLIFVIDKFQLNAFFNHTDTTQLWYIYRTWKSIDFIEWHFQTVGETIGLKAAIVAGSYFKNILERMCGV